MLGLDFSPIKGPEGNIEYLIYIEKRRGKPSLQRQNLPNSSQANLTKALTKEVIELKAAIVPNPTKKDAFEYTKKAIALLKNQAGQPL